MSIADRAVYATQQLPLQNQVAHLLKEASPASIEGGEILAVIVPDTNRISGGPVAAEVYKCLEGRHYDTVILISPSHTGPFRRLNICQVDTYRSPLGSLNVNDRVRNELCDEDDDIFMDDMGHYQNEGVDVQLPFLQTVLRDFDIVPIVMGEESPEFCRELGNAVGEIMFNRRTLVVASADLLETSDECMEQFQQAFEARDVSRMMSLLNTEDVKVEGKGAVLVAMIASLQRRADQAKLVRVQMPEGEDVGYIGGVIWRR